MYAALKMTLKNVAETGCVHKTVVRWNEIKLGHAVAGNERLPSPYHPTSWWQHLVRKQAGRSQVTVQVPGGRKARSGDSESDTLWISSPRLCKLPPTTREGCSQCSLCVSPAWF